MVAGSRRCVGHLVLSASKTALQTSETDQLGKSQFFADYASLGSNPSKGATMKKTLIRLILLAAAFLALSATTAMADGGGNMPLCWPPTTACQ